MASARACGFPGSHNMPPPEAATNSGNAACLGWTTGTPAARASMT